MTKLLKPLAILALLGFPISVLLYRFGFVEFPVSLKLIAVTLILAAAVFFIAMVISFVMRKNNTKPAPVKNAALIAIIPIIGLGSQVFVGKSVPAIHNISTNLENPATFDKVLSLRNENHNPHRFDADLVINKETGQTLKDLQRAAYPEVKTLTSNLSKAEAHAIAKSTAESMGWDLVNTDVDAGIVEATVTSFIWGFKDDVVIRILATEEGSSIDLHSVSRIGINDLGANAKRILAFIENFKKAKVS